VLERRHNNQLSRKITTSPIKIGMMIDRMETNVETISSRMLMGTLPAPPVVAETAGRIAIDLTA